MFMGVNIYAYSTVPQSNRCVTDIATLSIYQTILLYDIQIPMVASHVPFNMLPNGFYSDRPKNLWRYEYGGAMIPGEVWVTTQATNIYYELDYIIVRW